MRIPSKRSGTLRKRPCRKKATKFANEHTCHAVSALHSQRHAVARRSSCSQKRGVVSASMQDGAGRFLGARTGGRAPQPASTQYRCTRAHAHAAPMESNPCTIRCPLVGMSPFMPRRLAWLGRTNRLSLRYRRF